MENNDYKTCTLIDCTSQEPTLFYAGKGFKRCKDCVNKYARIRGKRKEPHPHMCISLSNNANKDSYMSLSFSKEREAEIKTPEKTLVVLNERLSKHIIETRGCITKLLGEIGKVMTLWMPRFNDNVSSSISRITELEKKLEDALNVTKRLEQRVTNLEKEQVPPNNITVKLEE